MKYVMLILNNEAVVNNLSQDEQQAWGSEVMAWYEKHGAAGVLAATGHQLQPPNTAKTVRSSGVTDGPFMETKEVLGGYTLLEAGSFDEAVEITKTWPGVDRGWITIELRPVLEM